MQANFSALYYGCSLKTLSDFYIFNTKISKLQISLQSSRTVKRPLPAITDKGLSLSNSFSSSS